MLQIAYSDILLSTRWWPHQGQNASLTLAMWTSEAARNKTNRERPARGEPVESLPSVAIEELSCRMASHSSFYGFYVLVYLCLRSEAYLARNKTNRESTTSGEAAEPLPGVSTEILPCQVAFRSSCYGFYILIYLCLRPETS
ncbi:hypothetical protein K402DRAFT_187516 [Aulographum hederae CBS 113979]|uniref:Uncharacterized protein n=1 Tax=Aulographum hederae CBS 113979 TaxID=1176131 RepID=A0A6G1GPF9_9PEZI|nr:hypothetical protein K402DRAFT_187516 [Aulographum hederae CBS 113979]